MKKKSELNPKIQLTLLLFTLLASLFAFRQFVLPLIGAQKVTDFAPGLNPPYLRLVKNPLAPQHTVEIRANTNNLPVLAVDIVLKYDAEKLIFEKENLAISDVLYVFQINPAPEGEINFSLFSNPKRGEPILKTAAHQEITLASLQLLPRQDFENTDLKIIAKTGEINESNLILALDPRPETPVDILENIQGVTLN